MEIVKHFKDGYTTQKLELEVYKTKFDNKLFVLIDNKMTEISSSLLTPPVSPMENTKETKPKEKEKVYTNCVVCTDPCKSHFKKNDCGCTFHIKCIKAINKETIKNGTPLKCKCDAVLTVSIQSNKRKNQESTDLPKKKKKETDLSSLENDILNDTVKSKPPPDAVEYSLNELQALESLEDLGEI